MCIAKIALLLVCFVVFNAQAMSLDWVDGTGSSDWANATNWNPAQVPTAADDCTITTGNVVISAAAAVQSLILSSASTVTVDAALTVWSVDNQYGTLIVSAKGSIVPANGTATYTQSDYTQSNFQVAGAVSIPITCSYGSISVWAGGDITGPIDSSYSCTVFAAPGAHISALTTTTDVVFQGPVDDTNPSIDIDEIWANGATFTCGNDTNVVVAKTFNTTGSECYFAGQGTITNGADAVSQWDYLQSGDDIVVKNEGWLATGTGSYSITLTGKSVFINNGQFVSNGRTELDTVDNAFVNNGNITTDDDGKNTDACYFYNYYGSSAAGTYPNVTNTGDITCPELRLYYLPLYSDGGNVNVDSLYLYGSSDGSDAVVTFSKDVGNLVVRGYGTVILQAITVNWIQSDYSSGGYIYYHCVGGNCTVNNYNSSTTNHWWSDVDSAFYFAGFYQTTYYEYLDGCTFVFPELTNQTSKANWYFAQSTVYSRGYFEHSGAYWTFQDSNSSFINQGEFKSLADWGVTDNSADGNAAIYNVGKMTLFDGGYFYCNFGTCNGGLLVLADTSDSTFYSTTYIQSYGRAALQGQFKIEFGDQVSKDFEFTYQTLWYYSSSATKYPEDYNDKGVPLTFEHEGDFSVDVRITTDGIDISFSDIDTCYVSTGLYGFSKGVSDSFYSCEDQPSDSDMVKGMCDVPLPPATIDINNPTGNTASSMVFSVLSVFIIASLFILF
jgi:hypothetical protein